MFPSKVFCHNARMKGASRRDELLRIGSCVAIVAVMLVALVLRLRAARDLTLHYDEHWHIFAAAAQPLSQFLAELRELAHPPLSYVALRLCLLFGDTGSHLAARLVSLVPGLLSLPVVYVCARRLQLGRLLSLLGVLIFALSPAHVLVSVVTRGYSLATLFVLCTYAAFLERVRHPERLGALYATFIFAMLAMWTEYSAWFAVAAMGMVPIIAGQRRLFAERRALRWFFASAVLMLGYLAVSVGIGSYGHIAPFLPGGGPLWRFALLAVARDLTLFSLLPVSLWAAAAVLVLGAVILLPEVRAARQKDGDLGRASAPLILAQLLGLLFILALIRIYPFGGEVRHQFVLFPFFVFCLLLLLDRVQRAMHPMLRCASFAAMLFATIYWGSSAAHKPLPEPPNWLPEWPADTALLVHAAGTEPLYVTGYSAYGLSGSLSGSLSGLTFVAESSCGPRCQRFTATARDGARRTIIKDSGLWETPSFTDAFFAMHLRDVITAAGCDTIWVYSLAASPNPADTPRIQSIYRQLGLHATQGPKMGIGEAWRISTRP